MIIDPGHLTFPQLASPPASTALGSILTPFATANFGIAEAGLPSYIRGIVGDQNVLIAHAETGFSSALTIETTAAYGLYVVNAGAGANIEGLQTDVIVTVDGGSGWANYATATTRNAAADSLYGYYVAPVATLGTGTAINNYGVWVGDQVDVGVTNSYAFWYNGIGANSGVYRINALGIMAYYNPSFADYTPGSVDYERIVQQWEADVATIRTEASGTGTLRSINLAGSTVQLNGKTITLANSLITSGNNSLTFTTTGATNVTLPTSGTLSTTTGTVTSIATTGPISGGTITSTGTISIADAAADGTTKGAAAFTAADFNASSGVISLDYTNGQKATASVPGFLSAADWATFNGKGAGTVTSIATTSPISGGTITSTGTLSLLTNVDFAFTAAQTVTRLNIGAVSTDGLVLSNTQAALTGAQQWSPRLHFTGAGFKSASVSTSQVLDYIVELQPVQETTAAQNRLVFSSQLAAGGYTPVLQVVTDGVNAPGSGDQVWIWESSGGTRGIWAGSSGVFIAGMAPGTGLSPNTDGGSAFSGAGLKMRGDSALVGWVSTTDPIAGTIDTIIRRGGAAATVQFGSDVNGAAVSQILQAANGITGTSKTGGNLTLRPGAGTDTAAVSSLIIQTPTSGGAAGTAQVQTTRLTIKEGSMTATVPFLLGTNYQEFTEMTAPAAGATNNVRIYAEDNGSGKTRLMALFPTGAAQVIATEP